MTSKVEQRLQEIGVSIPDAPTPAANYLPFTRTGNLVFVSGQVPFVDGKLSVTGTVGIDASIETVDDAQYFSRTGAFDFDITTFRRSLSLSPGSLVSYARSRWCCKNNDDDGGCQTYPESSPHSSS